MVTSTAISVCLCTHNPQPMYLSRALAALAGQTLDPALWELIVIDNCSDEPVGGRFALDTFARARVVAEPELGLTPARLRAIGEAAGEVLVFVDDDNVLAPDYLERTLEIMRTQPEMGAFGGQTCGEFETPPPRWLIPYLPYLAVGKTGDQPRLAREPNRYEPWFPCGAGLAVRRALARTYAEGVAGSEERRRLGRRGASLTSAEDIDLLLTVLDGGQAVGWFPQLRLTHLIPRGRLTFGYMWRMIAQANESFERLMIGRGVRHRLHPWPVSYLTNLLLCLSGRRWHPLSLLLALRIAHGRYAARRGK